MKIDLKIVFENVEISGGVEDAFFMCFDTNSDAEFERCKNFDKIFDETIIEQEDEKDDVNFELSDSIDVKVSEFDFETSNFDRFA